MTDTPTPSAASAGTIAVGDLTVNRLGFGAMRITGQGIWGDPPDREAAVAVVRRAVELGVDFIDTADSYGPAVSEELLAEALHPYPEGLVIATKGGLERPGPGVWTSNGRPQYLRAAAEASLKRLRVDRIDLYQYHRPDPEVPLADSLGALAELRDQGKIRYVGVSNFSVAQLEEAKSIVPVVSVQNRYNLADRSSEDVVDWATANGVAFLPWAPIQGQEDVPAAAEVAARHGISDRQLALAWLLARSPAILPIPGTGSVAHLEDNVAAAAVELAADDVTALTARTP